ncbi:glycoside hydrolase family 3 N-terminal domain-containing protein [Streptacidiphilus anmyonensis]|uniref:glycoside hydrolase family 3 N-terminal domain-containing protein n=1 Tax=Streptacidiphilus anmyonensis TaxID=405782 RepID=UPI000693E841|nr:glycoside hydrolase family 3 N-terminal domain-containing protein [Streptacidiphilus anmyonensis]
MRLHPSPAASDPRGLPVRASAVTLGFAMLLSGCAAALAGPTVRTSAAQPAADAVAATTCTNAGQLATWSNKRLAMTTIAVPVSETAPSAVTTEVAAGAGAVLLFGSSAPSNLGSQLATLRTHVPGHLGLLVMTDEEGGGIQRMANLVGSLPWPAYMGAHWTAAQIQANVAAVGKKMAAAGVNVDLAPVADVDGRNVAPGASDPDGWRSFSGNTTVAARDTVAYMNGLRSAGVIPVLKHFPGLGGASYNTDDGPAHTLPWATEKTVGLPPFTSAIAAGAPAVMMSNATVPGLATNPGGLSPTQITYELKGKLGFHGLVVTDSLDAKAVSAAGFGVPAAAVQALNSGADLVLFSLGSNVSSETNAVATAITNAVSGGHLARARLIDAAGQVLAVRHVNLC